MLAWLLACAGPEADPKGGLDSAPIDTAEEEPEDLRSSLWSPGPWSVGYRELQVAYEAPAGTGPRELRLAAWYPSPDSAGEETRYMGIFPAEGVWLGASPAPGPLPVALFSHGHQGYAENSSFLMEHLASHGWLVLAPDHTGNTTFDPPERSTEIYFQRPADLSAVLDHMAGLAASDPLAGLLGEPVVALGHSFGGYTVFALAGAAFDVEALSAACAAGAGPSPFCSTWSPELAPLFEAGFYDPRVSAFLPMAAGDSNLFSDGQGAAQVQGPVLMMTGDLDSSTPTDGEAWWAALSGGAHRRLQITGAGHQSYTDYAGMLGDAELEGLIDEQLGWDIVNAYTLAWLRLAAGDASVAPVLDGELPLDEAAQILR